MESRESVKVRPCCYLGQESGWERQGPIASASLPGDTQPTGKRNSTFSRCGLSNTRAFPENSPCSSEKDGGATPKLLSRLFGVAPALFEPPPQKDALAFYKTRHQGRNPQPPWHRPFGQLRLPTGSKSQGRGRFLPDTRGGHGSPLPTLPLLRWIRAKETSSRSPQGPLIRAAEPHLVAFRFPSRRQRQSRTGPPALVWNPVPTNHREIYSSRAVPLRCNARAAGPRRRDWDRTKHAHPQQRSQRRPFWLRSTVWFSSPPRT